MKRKIETPSSSDPVQRIVSIPEDVVLAPGSELPRHPRGVDRSSAKGRVSEMTWSQFDRCVGTLARAIHATYKPDAVVGIAHGGVFVGGALAKALECEFYPVRISRRSRDKQMRSIPAISGEMPAELKNKTVLVVDDVANSGNTLQLAAMLLEKVGARETKTACLVRRDSGFEPDWVALITDALTLFPWDYEPVTEDGRFGA